MKKNTNFRTVTAAFLLGLGVARAAPRANSTDMCADSVPIGEVQSGKSAFFSNCSSIGEIASGCWVPGVYNYQNEGYFDSEDTNYGCQTCIIQEPWAAGSVFNGFWAGMTRDGIAPCPTTFSYANFYATKYNTTLEGKISNLNVTTAASLTNIQECAGYPVGATFYNAVENKCYFKSDRYDLAQDFVNAASRCEGMGGALVAIDSEAENDWIIHNLLWTGFMGESYIGLYKYNQDNLYHYVNSSFLAMPKGFNVKAAESWYKGGGPWYPQTSAETVYADVTDTPRTCVVVYTNQPKKWNPYACENLLTQYICELPSASYNATVTPMMPFHWTLTQTEGPSTLAPTVPKTPAPVAVNTKPVAPIPPPTPATPVIPQTPTVPAPTPPSTPSTPQGELPVTTPVIGTDAPTSVADEQGSNGDSGSSGSSGGLSTGAIIGIAVGATAVGVIGIASIVKHNTNSKNLPQ